MGHRNREIERKFTVSEGNLDQVIDRVKATLDDWHHQVRDASRDYFWKPFKESRADFIRLRYMPNGTGQLTLKYTDKYTIVNRVEKDVEIDVPDQMYTLLEDLIGEPEGSVYKEYLVLFIDKKDTTVSVYRVRGDKRIFVEVEARTLNEVNRLTAQIGKSVTLNPEMKSLYQLFISERK